MSPHCTSSRQQGFALIAVLWLVAALSILVGGIMSAVKSEYRIAGLSRQTVVAKATAEGAMQLALQSVVATGKEPDKFIEAPVAFNGQQIMVQMTPMTGYIDLNRASPELLQAAFQFGAGVDAGLAGNIAKAIYDARVIPGPSGKAPGLEAVEDLLRIPGVDYAIYARVASAFTTDAGGSGRVNVQAAPPNVLNIVAGGNAGAVGSFMQARAGDNVGANTGQFNGAWTEGSSPSSQVEMTARVPLSDGGSIVVIRRYALSRNSPDGLPWQVFYADARVDLAQKPNT